MTQAAVPPAPTTHQFANAYEMAGYYTGHLLYRIEHDGEAPAQIGFLSGDSELLLEVEDALARTVGYEGIRDLLQVNPAGATAATVVTPNSRHLKHATALLAEVFDFVDGVTVDIVVPYRRRHRWQSLLVGEPEIVDIAGVDPVNRVLAEMGCTVDFMLGMAKHGLAVEALVATSSW